MGGLGSLVFFGIVFGSATATVVFNKIQYKHIIICALIVNGLALWLFVLTGVYTYMCISRFISGFS